MLNHSVINDCDNIYLCQCTDGVCINKVVKVRPVCMPSACTIEKYSISYETQCLCGEFTIVLAVRMLFMHVCISYACEYIVCLMLSLNFYLCDVSPPSSLSVHLFLSVNYSFSVSKVCPRKVCHAVPCKLIDNCAW